MSAAFNPFGMAPLFHESGILRPSYPSAPIASGYGTNIFQNAPVQIDGTTPTGNLIVVLALGASSATPAANTRILGTMQGVELTLTATGRRTVQNYWAAGTVATQITAWYTRDPNMTYQIQANGPIPQTALGNVASITANLSANGNTISGFSTVALDVATLTNGGTTFNQLRITGFSTDIDNAVNDAFTKVHVKIAMHQDVANSLGY